MTRVAHALGVDRHEAHVTLTEITATSHRGQSFRTEVAEVRTIGINADRLAELERFTRGLDERRRAHAEPATVEGVTAELDRISGKPPLYPVLAERCVGGDRLRRFRLPEQRRPGRDPGGAGGRGSRAGRSADPAASRLEPVRGHHARRGDRVAGLPRHRRRAPAGGLTAIQHESGYLSAVLFLIPGFALVTAALDLAKLDFSAGIARLVYGLMIVVSAALVVWGVSAAVDLQPHPVEPLALAPGVLLVLRLAASWFGGSGSP